MRLLDHWLDLLYPPKCAFCRKLTDDGRMICPDCERKLPFPTAERQRKNVEALDLCVSVLYYTGDVRQSLHRYKFGGAAAYCRIYGELMAECMRQHGIRADCVTWTPLSRQRLRKRGYDQAMLLAREVAERVNLPCLRLLWKTRNNPAQSGTKSAAERRSNVSGVYRASPEAEGCRILLIDDIVTTGSTLSEAAKVLRAAGAKSVTALTLAKAEEN